jgi:hypothetical protein
LEVVELGFGVVIVTAVAEGVDGGDFVGTGKVDDGTFTPGIVGVSGDGFSVFICDSNDIALQIFTEVVGNLIVKDTADAIRRFSLVYRRSYKMSIYRKNSRTRRCGCQGIGS